MAWRFACVLLSMAVVQPTVAAGASHGQKLVFGGDFNYPPYEYLDENGKPAGYNVDLTKALAEIAGFDIEIRLGPWAQVRRELEEGRIDAIQGMFYSVERDAAFDFSTAHTIVNHLAFARKGDPAVEDRQGFEGKEIVVMQGDIMHDWLLENRIGAKIVAVETQEEALARLAAGKHDLALVAQLPGLYWIQRLGLANLAAAGPPILSPKYCYAVRQGLGGESIDALDRGLAALYQSGRYTEIYQKWFGRLENRDDIPAVYLYFAVGTVLVLLLMLIASLIWSHAIQEKVEERTEELASEIEQRNAALRDLENSETRFRTLAETVPLAIAEVDLDGRLLYYNPACRTMFGFAAENSGEEFFCKAIKDEKELKELFFHVIDRQPRPWTWVGKTATRDGRTLDLRVDWDYRRALSGEVVGLVAVASDITEQNLMEEQLREAKKMEAVGTIAGGVAHEFNNILTVVLGNAELAGDDIPRSNPASGFLDEIRRMSLRGKKIVKQLLDYSRKSMEHPRPVNAAKIVKEAMIAIHHDLSNENVHFRFGSFCDGCVVLANESQLRQVAVNLCRNAVEALNGKSGTVDIQMRETRLETSDPGLENGMQPGKYLELRVRDNGSGIPADNIDRVFDPFFTTKRVGDGPGLGLSVVYGVVKKYGGTVRLKSGLGEGTEVRVYLPAFEEEDMAKQQDLWFDDGLDAKEKTVA